MGVGDRGHLKRKAVATASVRGAIPARRKKEATTVLPSQGFGILKKRKEHIAAQDLFALQYEPGGLDTWKDRWLEVKAKMEEDEAAVRLAKKRKRVVKQRFSQAFMEGLVATHGTGSFIDEDLTLAQLAKRSLRYRQRHAMATFIDGKLRDYEKALIDQYNALGYAEDEREVTDNEEDMTAEN